MYKITMFIVVVLVLILVTANMVMGQEAECEGATELEIYADGQFIMCWEKNPEPDVIGYRIYKDGAKYGEEYLQSDCGTSVCDSGPIAFGELGVHTFTIRAYDEFSESGDSNIVTLTVIAKPPPPTAPKTVRIKVVVIVETE